MSINISIMLLTTKLYCIIQYTYIVWGYAIFNLQISLRVRDDIGGDFNVNHLKTDYDCCKVPMGVLLKWTLNDNCYLEIILGRLCYCVFVTKENNHRHCSRLLLPTSMMSRNVRQSDAAKDFKNYFHVGYKRGYQTV